MKKSQLEEDNYKSKVFALHKWDFLKKIKAQMMDRHLQHCLKMKAIKTMMVYVLMMPLLKRIAAKYAKKKELRWYKERSVFVSLRVYQLMNRYLKKFGPNTKIRNGRAV